MVRWAVGCSVLALMACGAAEDSTDGDGVVDPNAIASTTRPDKRSEVFAAVDEATGQMLIFGGNDGPIVNQNPRGRFRNDSWIFEAGVGWREVVTADQPRRRGRYAIAQDDASGQALLFGGRFRVADTEGDYTLFNDLWSFDWATEAWTKLDDGTGPVGRYYPARAYDGDARRLYLWGGLLNSSAVFIQPGDDLWSWSAEEGWLEHTPTGELPSQRGFFGDAYDSKRNKLVVFGGQVGDFSSLAYNDMYALNLDDFTWERLHDGEGMAPSTRMHAALQYDAQRDRYLLFGGHTDIGDGNDLWAFDPEAKTWSIVYEGDTFTGNGLGCAGNPSDVPDDYVSQDLTAPERRHRGMHALLDDSIWLFGGIHSECSEYLDDTWRYDLATDTWVELIPARTGESCARRGDDCTCLCF